MVKKFIFFFLLNLAAHGANAATVSDVFGDIDNFNQSFFENGTGLDEAVIAKDFRMFDSGDGFLNDLIIPTNAGEITN